MPLYTPCQLCHCSMGCCHVCCMLFSVFPYIHFHVVCVAISVTEFVNFNSKMFEFLWDLLLECSLPFEKYDHLVNCQMFRRVVKLLICNIENIKNFLCFPQCVIIIVILIDFFVIVYKMHVT